MSLLLALASPALPCAGLITEDVEVSLASSDAQQAVFSLGEGTATVSYRVRYAGDAASFAWIIPVPGAVVAVTEGDEGLFEELGDLTAPSVYYDAPDAEESEPACGCGVPYAMDGSDRGGMNYDSGIDVTAQGYAGDYAYTALTATGAGAMMTWLADNGFDSSVSAAQIESYESDPLGFTWVAVKLRPDTPTTPEGGVNLSPLSITYGPADDGELHLLFPSRMGSSSMLTELRNEIFVVADTRAEPGGGWTGDTDPSDDVVIDGEEGDDPAEIYDALLRQQGQQKALWTAWAGPAYVGAFGDTYVTRLDTLVAPSVNSSDLDLVLTTDADSIRSTTILIPEAYGYDTAWLVAPLGVFAAGWKLRRRR